VLPRETSAQTAHAARGEPIAREQNVNHLFVADDRGHMRDVKFCPGASAFFNWRNRSSSNHRC
jgi:hypothetical protein